MSVAHALSETRRRSIALSQNPTLQAFRLVSVPEEESDDDETCLPDINETTKTLFEPHVSTLMVIVLLESFDKKLACIAALESMIDDASDNLNVVLRISYHPEQRTDPAFMALCASSSADTPIVCDDCSAAETDTGRMISVGWYLKDLFDTYTITRRCLVVVCCGKDVDFDTVQEMRDYVADRHACLVVYGARELQNLAVDVTKMVKWRRKKAKSRARSKGTQRRRT